MMAVSHAAFKDELQRFPRVRDGDRVRCTYCDDTHALYAQLDAEGRPNTGLLFYRCHTIACLGAVDGHLVAGERA